MERKDSWSAEHDNLLTDIVFSYLENGSTQLKAFEEAAEKLGRTPAACGFRWNSAVRKHHLDALLAFKGAKKGRHRVKQEVAISHGNYKTKSGKKPLAEVFAYIKELEQAVAKQQKEIEQLRNQIKHDDDRYIASEDIQTLTRIITHARQNGYLNQAN
ncbi:hypothetical protein N6H14_16315 [Paenibacillus sp. CC-CFT747]|nr:hypothetical protein N6H14_16315 [Paenibacillus sp. CC-CFT747]